MHFTWNKLHQGGEEMQQVSEQDADGRQQDFGKHFLLRRHQVGDGLEGHRCQDEQRAAEHWWLRRAASE